ncbi:MAG: bifunctional hydroxymethylpyrimidine kinase/phosphomethylpyrimidine kinase, partial [Nocardioides sp.]|nr:bifunctional hydroxymethylpyrimidine kinase/phosphomethylpyrimidine kinase [Nocardioides sp.]
MSLIHNTQRSHSHTGSTRPVPRVLSIAGTDPTGGAGIQADLKSIAANGGYGMAVATALVAQNTRGVRGIHVPPVAFLSEQLTAVSDDVTIDAVKIGMLFDTTVIKTVSEWLRAIRPPFVVLDPVMVAASADRLLTESAERSLRELIRSADLVTPNIPELAALLSQPEARTWPEAIRQARELSDEHDVLVLVKGGHLDGDEAPDALVHGPKNTVVEFSAPRIDTRNTHGTGCSLSAAVATLRAQTNDWEPAVRQAKVWLTESIDAASDLRVGHGNGPVSHFAGLWRRGGQLTVTAESVKEDWWTGIGETRAAIDELPFVRSLADGSLDEAAFTWYLAQDALYLKDYSRVLAEASRLAPTPAEQAFWASSAHGAIATELELHANWLPANAMFDANASEVTTEYVNHLLATAARGSYPEMIAAVLPCFWIYVDVGSRLVHQATPDGGQLLHPGTE